MENGVSNIDSQQVIENYSTANCTVLWSVPLVPLTENCKLKTHVSYFCNLTVKIPP